MSTIVTIEPNNPTARGQGERLKLNNNNNNKNCHSQNQSSYKMIKNTTISNKITKNISQNKYYH